MKRPWLMAAWPLLLLFYSSATLTAVVNSNKSKNNDARLKVSIRKDTMLGVPSCQHTFSQIELLNMHSTEPIMIYSIQTIPEETILVRPESSPSSLPSSPQWRDPDYGRSWSGNDIPQQLHVSKLPSKSLSLGPGQVAIVPVTFLPRYPSVDDCEGDDCEGGDGDGDRDREDSNNDTDNDNDNDKTDKNVDDYYTTAVTDGRSPPPLSSTAKLDLVDLVGKRVLKVIDNKRQYLRHTLDPTYRRRNNMNPNSLPRGDEQYDVTTTVVVDTSRGVVKLPISASSIRDNSYRIPDVIKFHHPTFTKNDDNCDMNAEDDDELDDYDTTCDSGSTEAQKRMHTKKGTAPKLTSMDGIVILDTLHATDKQDHADEKNYRASVLDTIKPERECFDLYLSNPFLDRELQVMEVLVSRPEFVSVQFDPERMAAPDLTMLVGSGPSQVVRQWTVDGPLYLPPESDNHYILSICTAFEGEIDPDEGSETYLDEMSKWIDSGDPTRNLGFLQIRTDAETLFIGLEHAENVPFLSLNNGALSGGGLQTSRSNNHSSSLAPSVENSKSGTTSTLLKSFPDRLDFDMISTTSPAMRATFGLQNKSPVPIRIMRVTVGVDSAGDKENAREIELIGLNLNVGVKKSVGSVENDTNSSGQLDSLILGAATSLDNILELTCSLNPDRFFSDSNKEGFYFIGTVVIRGTMDTELSYNQWREETLRNPYRDEHLTVELPFAVSILNGRVEALIERSSHPYPQLFAAQSWDGSGRAVSHLFFPMNQYAAIEGTEDVLPQQMYLGANEIRHDLRILSNMVFPLNLVGAKIIDDDPHDKDSLCNRFNVSTSAPSNSDDLYFGFEEIGLLLLKYKFGTKGKRGEKHQEFFPRNIDPYLPKRCSMIVMTSSEEEGTFKIPLLIFPGRLEVSSVDSSVVGNSEQSRAFLGFGHLFNWCKSSRLGNSFIEALQNMSEDRRKPKSDSDLLSKYISDNSGWDLKAKPKFLPILLKIGAIDSGKLSKMNVYLTNHNPIPLTVSIDVGEVEGMSINLSRDASQATGDGNSLLDHLPTHPKGSLVKMGKNKDHPVAGLLEFLTSDEQAHEFMSKFNFRDSLLPHDPAITRSDVLQLLHDWHSEASFHREPVSSQSSFKHSSKCKEGVNPPVYSSFNSSRKETKMEGRSGPLIFSSDKRLARPLTECWRRDPTEMSSDRIVIKIPPGARARFEVQVRAPPQEYLKDDISHILMSGLILSTNLGDVMPIFVIFEALQGQLHASHVQSTQLQDENDRREFSSIKQANSKIMNVPLEFTWNSHDDFNKKSHIDAITIPPANWTAPIHSMPNISYYLGDESSGYGVPLYLRSSFSRNVRLLNVDSCNPWFRFVPLESGQIPERLSDDGILVGFIRTNVDCTLNHSTDNGFPSFYQCMLNWFSNRLKLQPEGCGAESNLKLKQIDTVKRSIEVVLRRLKKSYKSHTPSDASSIDLAPFSWNESDFSHIKTGRRKNDGLIPDLALYDDIWKSLKIAHSYGYNLLSSSLKATVEYDSETLRSRKEDLFNTSLKQNLSLSIHDLDVQSVLEAPKLFASDRDYLEFNPTIVGSVAYSYIAVQNPTGVPVKVRLGIAPSEPTGNSQSHSDIYHRYESEIRQNPYVQNGKSSVPSNESTSYSWWDGNGAFFIPNEQGDVIRSHSNISVTGGGGATSISLVNPSLNSQVGFLVGCGKRCGLGDQNDANTVVGNPMACSPIGASAASGITLKGNIRYNSPELNDKTIAEPIILAGGTSVSIADGPAAFAIPYSALDEIVIPPFGKGQLGPIYFRPPGRHKTLGCDVAKQSGGRLKGEKEVLCKSQKFDSVLYLENSLTGMEEVGLRGKSVWNYLYFVDPPPKRGEDAFGDIEFRDGMPTLIFSGTSNTVVDSTTKHSLFGKTTQHLSVVKEVILHNGGDAASEIAAVSLLGMSIDREKQGSCSYGSFRLLNCWESMPSSKTVDMFDTNIRSGFVLKPGENRSLFVEHIPDCRMKKESVNLHVELSHANFNRASKPRRSRARGMENPFGKKETNMLLGYQMDVSAFSRCTPGDTRLTSSVIHTDLASMNHVNYTSRTELKSFDNDQEESPVLIFQIFLFSTAALVLCYALRARFHAILAMLQKIQGEPEKNVRNWNAAFRCLARSHPTSLELQTMSREQMRQDVIGRYKAKGNTPSSSLNSTNGFSRDRRAAISKTLRHRTGKEGSSGNERTRPFSDALFHDTSIADDSSLRVHFPIGLGWRTAYSRGIIKDNSLQSTTFSSRTKILLGKRAELASKNNKKNWNESNNQEAEKSEKIHFIEGKVTPSLSSSFSDDGNSNGTKNELVETETAVARDISASESEATKANMVEINHTNGDQWNMRSKINQDRGIAPVAKGIETVTSTEPKAVSSKQPDKPGKQNKWNGVPTNQPSKNVNTSEGLKRTHKHNKNAPKTIEGEDSNKLDTFSKNAKWGQNQKEMIPAKSALLDPLPKRSSPNAWRGECQKPDTKPSAKKETIKIEKKSKGKDKSKKKKVAKQNTQGKKSILNSTKQSETVPVESKDSGANITQARSHPVLSPPPGFGAPQRKNPLSPSANTHLHHMSKTDGQISLDTMLHADLSLGAPLQASSAQLPFPQSNAGGNDLLFKGTILEPGRSPTMRGFNVADVAMTTENSSALPSSAEQPWLPTLLTEDSEPVEQPWLPALLNEEAESGFDVMDFLGGILQDGSPTEAEPILEIEPSAPGTPSSIAVGVAGNPSSTPVAANPWAMESRAAAYGISFDNEDGKSTKDPTTELEEILKGSSMEKVLPEGLGDNIPLLTKAAILNAEGNNKVAEEDDDKAISFYAGLLEK